MARPLISNRTMRKLRALSDRALPDTATFRRPGVPTDNGRGGFTSGMSSTFTEACRYRELSGDEEADQGLIRAGATAAIELRVDADVRTTDTLIGLTLNGVEAPGAWNIVHAPAPSSYSASRVVGIKKGSL